jgi:hypothetical protein
MTESNLFILVFNIFKEVLLFEQFSKEKKYEIISDLLAYLNLYLEEKFFFECCTAILEKFDSNKHSNISLLNSYFDKDEDKILKLVEKRADELYAKPQIQNFIETYLEYSDIKNYKKLLMYLYKLAEEKEISIQALQAKNINSNTLKSFDLNLSIADKIKSIKYFISTIDKCKLKTEFNNFLFKFDETYLENCILYKELPILDTQLEMSKLTWGKIINNFKIACFFPFSNISVLNSVIAISRLHKKEPKIISDGINIESLAREIRTGLSILLETRKFIKENFDLVYLLNSTFSTNENLINHYRICAWNWYKTIAEITHKTNIESYVGFEKELLHQFHDSPSQIHLEVFEKYTDYLIDNTTIKLEIFSTSAKSIGIEVDCNFLERIVSNKEEIIKSSLKLLEVFKNLYSLDNQKENIIYLQWFSTKHLEIANDIKKLLLFTIGSEQYDLIKNNKSYRFYNISSYQIDEYSIENLVEISNIFKRIITKSYKIILSKNAEPNEIIDYINLLKRIDNVIYRLILEITNSSKFTKSEKLKFAALNLTVISNLCNLPNKKLLSSITNDIYNFINNTQQVESHISRINQLSKLIINQLESQFSSILLQFESLEINKNYISDFLADIIRETPIFTISNLIESNSLNKTDVIVSGSAIGYFYYIKDFENEIQKNHLTLGIENRIIITEKVSSHFILPKLKGLITLESVPLLSHIAINANEKEIVWFQAKHKNFEEYVKVAKNEDSEKNIYKITANYQECKLEESDPINFSLNSEKNSLQTIGLDFNVDFSETFTNFDKNKVGNKAYNLYLLNKNSPEHSIDLITLSFYYFEKYIYNRIEDKYITSENNILPENLEKINEIIDDSVFDFIPGLLKVISENFGNSKLMIRSSTNAEDLENHPAAGIYESHLLNKLSSIQLEQTLKKVYKSFYSSKALADRSNLKINEQTAKMCIIIQKVIDFNYSFVLHTNSPISNDNSSLIEIAPLYGESLVSGESIYEGNPYRFIYDKNNKEIELLTLCNKNYLSNGFKPVLYNYSNDILLCGIQTFKDKLTEIFDFALKIENQFSVPQDIEGIINFSNKNFDFYFVQARNQIVRENTIEQKLNTATKIENSSPIIHTNLVELSAFDTQLNSGKRINISKIVLDATSQIFPNDKLMLMPYGSNYYLTHPTKGTLYNYVRDFEYNIYFLEDLSIYDKKEYLYKNKEKFGAYIINGIKKRKVNFYAEYNKKIDNYFKIYNSWYPVYGTDTSIEGYIKFLDLENFNVLTKKEFESTIINKISQYSFDNADNIFYSPRYIAESDFGYYLLTLVIYSIITKNKIFIIHDWVWDKLFKDLEYICRLFDIIEVSILNNKKTFVEYIINNFFILPVGYYESEVNYEKQYVQYLPAKKEFTERATLLLRQVKDKNVILSMDHIDLSLVLLSLGIIEYSKNGKLDEDFLNILKLAEDSKDPAKNLQEYNYRINVENEGIILKFCIQSLIAPIKKEKMSREDATKFIVQNKVFETLYEITNELKIKSYNLCKKFTKGKIKELKDEFDLVKLNNNSYENEYKYSKSKQIALISNDSKIISFDLKLLLPKEKNCKILIQYKNIKNSEGEIVGYRYTNIGRLASSNTYVGGLQEFLAVIELFINDFKENLEFHDLWSSHDRYDYMVEGPAESESKMKGSKIPPDELVELLEIFLVEQKKLYKKYTIDRLFFTNKKTQEKYINSIIKLVKNSKVKKIVKKICIKNSRNLEDFDKINVDYESNQIQLNYSDSIGLYSFSHYARHGFIQDINKNKWSYKPIGYLPNYSYFGDQASYDTFCKYLELNPGKLNEKDYAEVNQFFISNPRANFDLKISDKEEMYIKALKELLRVTQISNFEDYDKLYNYLENVENADKLELAAKIKRISEKYFKN